MLKKGSYGLQVKKLQYRLETSVDGIFGSGTEAQVKLWQYQNDLSSTGIMKNEDWNAMFGCNVNEWTPIGMVVHCMSEYVLYEGSWLPAKKFLKKLGYSVHAFIHSDGHESSMISTNQKAIHAGQSKHGVLSNLNSYFLGFEILVNGKNTLSQLYERIKYPSTYNDYQFISSVNLANKWIEKYNIPKKDIVRHSDVSGDDVRGPGKGKQDPGIGFPWQQFKGELIEK